MSMASEPQGPLYIGSDVYRENAQPFMVPLDFSFGGQYLSIRIPSNITPTEAVECSLKHARQSLPPPSSPDIQLSNADFVLKLSGFDILLLENEPIMKNAYFDHLVRSFVLPRLSVVHKSEIKSRWSFPLTQQDFDRRAGIVDILGKDYYQSITTSNDLSDMHSQINTSRQNFARFRLRNESILQQTQPPRYIGSIPLNSKFIPPKLRINIEWQSGIKVEQIVVDPLLSGDELMKLSVQTLLAADIRVTLDRPIIIKVRGIRSYICGSEPIFNYDYIRKCLIDGRTPHLVLMHTPQVYLRSKSGGSPCLVDRVLAVNLPQAPAATPLSMLTDAPAFSKPFCLKAIGCCFFHAVNTVQRTTYAQLHIALNYGGKALCPPAKTSVVGCSLRCMPNAMQMGAVWDEVLSFPVPLGQLPSGVRITVALYTQYSDNADQQTCVGWSNFLPIGYGERLQKGGFTLRLQKDGPVNAIGPAIDSAGDGDAPLVDLELPKHEFDVSFSETREEAKEYEETTFVQRIIDCARLLDPEESPEGYAELEKLKSELLTQDALVPITETQKALVWKYRFQLIPHPELLPMLLLSTDWADRNKVIETHLLIKRWAKITPTQALRLLGWEFPDHVTRAHAVNSLETLSDPELACYLQQLVWVIKYESFHESPLACFLVERALRNQESIGHPLFWCLRREILHDPSMALRYGLILEAYLLGCSGPQVELLSRELSLCAQLSAVSAEVKKARKEKRTDVLFAQLNKVRFAQGTFVLPLDSSLECSGLIVSGCKVLKSLLSPIFLTFRNADPRGEPIQVIFKTGDDLRQDDLALQMIHIMDSLWNDHGLDLKMSCYKVVSTGVNEGMIEVVTNAETIGNITRPSGSFSVFKYDLLEDWLRRKAPSAGVDYQKAVDNFTRSCAGYCVATFVLGVGDRHNDNIMLCNNGKLLHIDFGHFLGHFLKKFGIEREKAPFVFTPQFAKILGGQDGASFKKFESLSVIAFNIIRKNSPIFINLALLMLSIGLPELNSVEDVMYLHDHLLLDKKDEEAAGILCSLVRESLNTGRTQINDLFHLFWN